MTHGQITATIAYSMDAAGFTQAQRWLMAEVFADELRLKGPRRERFLNDCRKHSEQQSEAYLPEGAGPSLAQLTDRQAIR